MWDFISPISLIRYLVVWRVNGSLVQLPRYLPLELSQVLATLIAERLPAPQAREWRKTLEAWETATQLETKSGKKTIPTLAWPLESVLFAYPNKRAFGPGEVILWELKLIGNSADHGIFLELILPAMEQAATTTDARWSRHNGLWGHFDIQAIYISRGTRWEPIVTNGKLNLNYRASPTQWAEGLTLTADSARRFCRLTWLTPFDFEFAPADNDAEGNANNHESEIRKPRSRAPMLYDLIGALMERMTVFLPGKRRAASEVWTTLSEETRTTLRSALEQTQSSTRHRQKLTAPPRDWPGKWIGTQIFSDVPPSLIPYLEVASIIHIGKHTHLGCGTFRVDFF